MQLELGRVELTQSQARGRLPYLMGGFENRDCVEPSLRKSMLICFQSTQQRW